MANDTRYAYAVSRIRALEPALLDRAGVDRLVGQSPDGLLQWARESEYAAAFADVGDVSQFPQGLQQHLAAVFELLDRIAPVPALVNIFRLRYDYHNLKVLFQGQALQRPVAGCESDLGTVPFDRLAQIVQDKDWLWLPEPMRDTWQTAERAAARQVSLRVIGAMFDNARYTHSLAIAREHGDALLTTIFQQAITVHNIQTFMRVKDGAAEREEFEALLIDDGALDRHFFRRHFDEPIQLFLDSLGRTDYARHMLTRGIEALPDTRDYWHLDLARDNYFLYFLGQTVTECFTIGPLVYYLVRKKAEVKVLHMLWLAARAGWERATIRERLRGVYA